MAKDIHIILEKKKKDNTWEYIEDKLDTFDCRSYRLFYILENEFGHRGIPEELKGKKFNYIEKYNIYDYDTTDSDLFHHSYATLLELENYFDKLNKVFVSEEFMHLFLELGGVLPKGMSFDYETKDVYVEPMDEEDIQFKDFINYGLDEFRKIRDKYKLESEEIRMVYAFDC